MVASSADGRAIALNLSVSDKPFRLITRAVPPAPTPFRTKLSIRGLVIEDGTLRAIIAGTGPLPGETDIAAFAPVITEPPLAPEDTGPVGPTCTVFGTNRGGSHRRRREAVTVYGAGFCAGPGCSTVRGASRRNDVAQSVPVGTNGNFQMTFPAPRLPDSAFWRAGETRSGSRLPDFDEQSGP